MNNKLKKFSLILSEPKKLGGFLIEKYGKNLSSFFRNKSFYLQGQMDIHPASIWNKIDFINETGGFYPRNDSTHREIIDLEPWDNTRRDMIILLIRTLLENDIPGDFVEVGVYRGYTAKLIHKYVPERKLYLFDTFSGFNKRGIDTEKIKTGNNISSMQFTDTSVDIVTNYIEPNNNVFFFPGYFPENMPANFERMKFALVHLDADLYDPIINSLRVFYENMSTGGIIIIHDYNAWIGARTAVDEFFMNKPEKPVPMPDKSGSAIIIKQ